MIPMVRIPATEYHFVARVLDMGAMGIMVPMVESAAQARKIVESAKYPPLGRRGAAFAVAHDDYTGGDIVEKIQTANSQTLLDRSNRNGRPACRNVNEIAAIEGIDVLWIGHFDLSNSLGIPGQFDHPRFQEAVGQVIGGLPSHMQKAAVFWPAISPAASGCSTKAFACSPTAATYGFIKQPCSVVLKLCKSMQVSFGLKSRHNRANHIPMHVGQPSLNPVVIKRQPGVIDSKQVQDRGVKIMHVHGILGRLPANLVGSAIGHTVPQARSGQPNAEGVSIVIAPWPSLVCALSEIVLGSMPHRWPPCHDG